MKKKVGLASLGAVVVMIGAVVVMSWDSREPRVTSTGSGVILIAGKTNEGSDAGFQSRLAFTTNGCLGLAGPGEDAAGAVAVFPWGTEVVETDPLAIRVNGERVELGQVFSGGGGGDRHPANNELIPTGHAECFDRPVFLIAPE